MAYVEIIDPENAEGARAEYYEQISQSYTAYLDVLDTTAIQNALDRLTWALGVPGDSVPLLRTS
jgi:hypothetical protein